MLEDMLGGERKVKGERMKGERMKEEGGRKKGNRFVRKWGTMKERLKNAERIGQYSPEYARHMKAETLLHGALRLFAKDRHWE